MKLRDKRGFQINVASPSIRNERPYKKGLRTRRTGSAAAARERRSDAAPGFWRASLPAAPVPDPAVKGRVAAAAAQSIPRPLPREGDKRAAAQNSALPGKSSGHFARTRAVRLSFPHSRLALQRRETDARAPPPRTGEFCAHEAGRWASELPRASWLWWRFRRSDASPERVASRKGSAVPAEIRRAPPPAGAWTELTGPASATRRANSPATVATTTPRRAQVGWKKGRRSTSA